MRKNTDDAATRRDFKQIADTIAWQASMSCYRILPGVACESDKAEFLVDGLTVRCNDTPESIASVVAKFNRGLPRCGRTLQRRA